MPPDADGRIRGISVPRLPPDMEAKRQELDRWEQERRQAQIEAALRQAEQEDQGK